MSASSFSRRELLLAGGGLLAGGLLPGVASANQARTDAVMRAMPALYRTVGSISGEHRNVRMFFSPTCEFSRQHHEMIFRWGMTLPKTLSFMPTPVIASSDDSVAPNALIFYSVWFADPAKLGAYMLKVYDLIQGSAGDPTDIKTYMEAARRAGIKIDAVADAFNKPQITEACASATRIGARYRLERTPTVGVCGRYAVTPDGVAGNRDLFVQLLNALTSKAILDNAG